MGIKETLVKFGMKVLMGAKEASPEICLVAGVGAIAAGTFLMCKATLTLDDHLEQRDKELHRINDGIDDQTLPDYTEEVAKGDVTKVKTNFVLDVAKEYVPGALVMVGGITLLFLGHKILRDRNTALMGAYSALATAFAAYRKRVIEYDGKEQDIKYMYGDRTPGIVVAENEETGEETVTLVEKGNEEGYLLGSPYARIFDAEHSEVAASFATDPHNDLKFTVLKHTQAMWNNKLQTYGFVFLNDVLASLGFPKVPEGQLVGWRLLGNGDGYIDFGIDNCYTNPECRDIVDKNGFTRKIVLDFNVDGVIYDKIGSGLRNELTEDELWALQNK